MSTPVILLVSSDAGLTKAVTGALDRCGLPRPICASTGEEAILLLSEREYHCGVLDYRLRGIDGLETLLRLRQRRPNLPVIMVSNERTEAAAIAAFHAGVVDYVPQQQGFAERIAQLVEQIVRPDPTQEATAPQSYSADVPETVARPTYQNRLRAIGWQLDLYGYRSLNLSEVAGGFLVRALPKGGRMPEALEFPDRDFPQLIAGAVAPREGGAYRGLTDRLLPTGYEEFLHALGHRLDEREAEAIIVTELTEFVVVAGVAQMEGLGPHAIGPFQQLLRADEIATLLDKAALPFMQPTRKVSVLGQLFRR